MTTNNPYVTGVNGPDYTAFSDPDGNDLTFTAVSDDPTVNITVYPDLFARFTRQHAVGDTITVTITAHDGKGGEVSSIWIIQVVEAP